MAPSLGWNLWCWTEVWHSLCFAKQIPKDEDFQESDLQPWGFFHSIPSSPLECSALQETVRVAYRNSMASCFILFSTRHTTRHLAVEWGARKKCCMLWGYSCILPFGKEASELMYIVLWEEGFCLGSLKSSSFMMERIFFTEGFLWKKKKNKPLHGSTFTTVLEVILSVFGFMLSSLIATLRYPNAFGDVCRFAFCFWSKSVDVSVGRKDVSIHPLVCSRGQKLSQLISLCNSLPLEH